MNKRKKFELTNVTLTLPDGTVLHRIRALRNITGNGVAVKAGKRGGWVENEGNLSQEGDCWISDDAKVYGASVVMANAWVTWFSEVKDSAVVEGAAYVGIALPALEGTDKQIAWAADIRAVAVAEMFDSPSAARNALAKAIKATPTSPAEALASALKGQGLAAAKWWIDHRDELCGSILAERLAANLAAAAN